MAHPDSADSSLPARRVPLLAVGGAALVAFLAVGAVVAAQWSPLMRADLAVARILYDEVFPRPGLAHGVELWTEIFGTWAMRILALAVALWLLLRRQVSSAAWAVATVFVANLAGLIGKLGIDRPRPDFVDPIASGVGPSFPSGHALMATVGMGILLFATLPLLAGIWRVVAWLLAGGIAVSTAGSRPALGVHWLSDVGAGMALGVAVVALALLLWSVLPPLVRRWDAPGRAAPRRGDTHGIARDTRGVPRVGEEPEPGLHRLNRQ